MKSMKLISTAILLGGLMALAACGGAKVSTAEELADQLKEKGISYDTRGPATNAPRPPRVTIDEAIELKGENLHVEVLRVEDEDSRKLMLTAMAFVGLADKFSQEKTGESLPGRPEMYLHKSLIVIVREEPQAGQVKAALDQIFPK